MFGDEDGTTGGEELEPTTLPEGGDGEDDELGEPPAAELLEEDEDANAVADRARAEAAKRLGLDGEEDDGGEEGGEGKPAAPGGRKPVVLDDVVIPTPRQETKAGEERAADFHLTAIPKEAADTMRHYIGEAARVPTLERQVAEGNKYLGFIELVNGRPADAMALIAHHHGDQGVAPVQAFVTEWLQAHPDAAAAIRAELDGEEGAEPPSPRERQLLARDAAQRMGSRADAALSSVQQTVQRRQYHNRAAEVIDSVVETLGLQGDDAEAFSEAAGGRLASLYKEEPSAPIGKMRARLESLVGRFAPKAPAKRAAPQGASPVTPAKVFKARKDTQDKHRKANAGGSRSIVPAAGFLRSKPGETIDDVNRRMRAGQW